jgi:NAD(P)-dependent dehydrogenase (short-subunit alcohol dehydrogenase family)
MATSDGRRVVVVTGGSAGIGRAITRRFGAAGDAVAVLARGEDGLAGAVKDVEAGGGRAIGIPTDVADPDAVEAAASRVEQELGEIDVWVNNAMAGVFAPFWEVGPAEYRRVTEVNYLGYVWGTRSALTHMRPRNRGVIVQVGSALAHRGIPLQSAYCGSKHAIVGFTESVITELLHEKSKVRVCMVHMPALNTMQFDWVDSRLPDHPQPVPPIFQPEVAARAVFHMAAHPRREMWVGAPTVATIVGNRLVPRLLDRYLARTGFTSQQAPDHQEPMLPTNVWEPVPGDHGAHGDFDQAAHERSAALWVSRHRTAVTAGMAGAAAAAVTGWIRRR